MSTSATFGSVTFPEQNFCHALCVEVIQDGQPEGTFVGVCQIETTFRGKDCL